MNQNVVSHPRPAFSTPGGRFIRVDLSASEMPGRFEDLWAHESAEGGFVVSCIPFFARGIAFGDLIVASPPDFVVSAVVKHSGLFTLRACFREPGVASLSHEAVHEALLRLGLPFEWHGVGYFAVLLSSISESEQVRKALAGVVVSGALAFELEPGS